MPKCRARQIRAAQPQSLWDEIIKGGPAGAWNTNGFWENPELIRTNTAPFYGHPGDASNSLATERNLMQVDVNYDLDGRNHFFLRWWGVYEPAYAFEQYTVRSMQKL